MYTLIRSLHCITQSPLLIQFASVRMRFDSPLTFQEEFSEEPLKVELNPGPLWRTVRRRQVILFPRMDNLKNKIWNSLKIVFDLSQQHGGLNAEVTGRFELKSP